MDCNLCSFYRLNMIFYDVAIRFVMPDKAGIRDTRHCHSIIFSTFGIQKYSNLSGIKLSWRHWLSFSESQLGLFCTLIIFSLSVGL